MIFTKENFHLKDLAIAFSPTLINLISFVNLKLGDFATARFLVTGFEFHDGEYHCEGDVHIRTQDKIKPSDDDISNTMSSFANFELNSSDENKSKFAAAGRRLITSMSENDVIDKYCDLWEACEFILKEKRETSIGGNIVKKLSKKLYDITGVEAKKIDACLIGKLYVLRCNVVHNAYDRITMIGAENDMEVIVDCLMKDYVGVHYDLKRMNEMLSKHGLL